MFYVQRRVGRNGRLFPLLKFTTMVKDSEKLSTGLITTKSDPRVLPVGRILRRLKINEIPQIMNVLKGDMSIVGPRPQVKEHFDVFPEHVKKEIVKVRPGLTGIGSIVFRDEECIMANSKVGYEATYKELIAPYKGELELWYIRNQSVWVDLILIGLTAWVILFPESNIYNYFLKELPYVKREVLAGLALEL